MEKTEDSSFSMDRLPDTAARNGGFFLQTTGLIRYLLAYYKNTAIICTVSGRKKWADDGAAVKQRHARLE